MNEKLTKKVENFDNKRNALLDEISSLDEAKLNARPFEGKWSVLEIVEHLVKAEREVMGGLADYAELKDRKQSFKNGLLYRIVMTVLKLGIPVKVPSKTMLPHNEFTFAELRERWDENQDWFRGYIETLGENDLQKAVFMHPVSGPITLEQAIDMSHLHLDNHTGQIKKRLEIL